MFQISQLYHEKCLQARDGLDFSVISADNGDMDIQGLSMVMSQSRVREEAAVQVQAMTLDTAKEQAADLARIMASAEVISDPAKGNFLDISM